MWWIVIAITLCLRLHAAQVTVCRATDETNGFLLQVAPYSSTIQRRQTSVFGYLDSTGAIHPFCQAGSTWNLRNGELSSGGTVVSTPSNIAVRRFSTSSTMGGIDSIFAVTENLLFWDNPAFDNGTARFVAASNAILSAVFAGSMPSGVQVSLKIVPLTSCVGQNPASLLGSASSQPIDSSISFVPANSGLPLTTSPGALTSPSTGELPLSPTASVHASKLSTGSPSQEQSNLVGTGTKSNMSSITESQTISTSPAAMTSSDVVSPGLVTANNTASPGVSQSSISISASSRSSATPLTTPSLSSLLEGTRILQETASDSSEGNIPSTSTSSGLNSINKSSTTSESFGSSLPQISQSLSGVDTSLASGRNTMSIGGPSAFSSVPTILASQSLTLPNTEVAISSTTSVPSLIPNPSQADSRLLLSSQSTVTAPTTSSNIFSTTSSIIDSSASSFLPISSLLPLTSFLNSESASITGLPPVSSTALQPESRLLDSSLSVDTSSFSIGTISSSTAQTFIAVSSSTQSSVSTTSKDTLASISATTSPAISIPESRILISSQSSDNSTTSSSSVAAALTVSSTTLASVSSRTTTPTQSVAINLSSSVSEVSPSASLALPTHESRVLDSSLSQATPVASSSSTFIIQPASSSGTSSSLINGSSVPLQSLTDTLLSSTMSSFSSITSSPPPPLSTVSQGDRAVSSSQNLETSSATSVSHNSTDSSTIPTSSLSSTLSLNLPSTAPRLESSSNASSTIAPASLSSSALSSTSSQVTSNDSAVPMTSNPTISTILIPSSSTLSSASLPAPTISPPDSRVLTSGQDFITSSTVSNVTITETTTVTSTPGDETVFVYMDSTMVVTHTTASDTLTSLIYPTSTQNITTTIYKTITEVSTQTTTTEIYSQLIEKRVAAEPTQNDYVPLGILKKFALRDLTSASAGILPSQATNFTVTVVYTSTTIAPQRTITVTVPRETSQDQTLLSGDDILVATNPPTLVNATQTTEVLTTVFSTTTATVTQVISTVSSAQATAIVGDIHGSPDDYDDFAYMVTLPFNVQIYDHAEPEVWVTTNGIISLDNGTYYYDNTALPQPLPVPDYSAFPFWDDTAIYKTQPQGIYYKVTGFGNGTIVTFDFYLSHYNDDDFDFHYTATYDSSNPGVWVYRYYRVADEGASATVGIQNYNASEFLQYSFNQSIVYPGLELTFDTLQGTMKSSTFDVPNNATSTVP